MSSIKHLFQKCKNWKYLLPILILSTLNVNAVFGQQSAPLSFANLVEKVRPAVVSIRVTSKETTSNNPYWKIFPNVPPGSPFEQFFKDLQPFTEPKQNNFVEISQGSGFFISDDGYIVTNNHVVKNAKKVSIISDNGSTYSAEIIGTDKATDLALLKVNEKQKFPFVSFSDNEVKVGEWVIAIGNPFGLGGTVTAGIVSAHNRYIGATQYDDFIQIDAPVNHGNSGGPVFDTSGHVIGISTAILSPSGGGNVGIAFAIPASQSKIVIAALKNQGSVSRGYLGVTIQNLTKDLAKALKVKAKGGALINNIMDDSPAQRAGLQSGDAIIAVNNKEIKNNTTLSRSIAAIPPGRKVKLTIVRQGKVIYKIIQLEELHNEKHPGSFKYYKRLKSLKDVLGFEISRNRAGDLIIYSVKRGSDAWLKGIRSGMQVIKVDGKPVNKIKELNNILKIKQNKNDKLILLQLEDERGHDIFTAIKINSQSEKEQKSNRKW